MNNPPVTSSPLAAPLGGEHSAAISRWASIGPYYAMFPVEFAFRVIARHAPCTGGVLDPFAGRASSVYAAAASGRTALGIEINPVGWVYGAVKLHPARRDDVLARLTEVVWLADGIDGELGLESRSLTPFFRRCYCERVLRFLTVCRRHLDWYGNRTDRTLMAFLLVYLHGKRGAALSNQMRDGKAMAPDYARRWWRDHEMLPPTVDPLVFLTKRIWWRYRRGEPHLPNGELRLGDSVDVLPNIVRSVARGMRKPFGLLFTSPPYLGVTNYHYDQWLRRWVLGGPTSPKATGNPHEGRFESKKGYRELLEHVFGLSSEMMHRRATVYVRTDARPFSLDTTIEVLRTIFPKKRLRRVPRPLERHTQTALFGDKSEKPGDVDLILAA